MRVVIAAVGRPRDPSIGAAISDYEKRAAHYWALDVREVKEGSGKGRSAEDVRKGEGERLRERLADVPTVVVCEADGRQMTSEAFAAWLERERDLGRDMAFVIGGAFGLAPEVRASASSRLSLAPWTLPHELARLVLAEQLYRAGSILKREPYHK